jgi:beta-xylosidase
LVFFTCFNCRNKESGTVSEITDSVKRKPNFSIAEAPAPLFRDPVFDGAADPSVLWDGQAREWLIFYTARRASLELPGVAYCYGTSIGIAASGDNGKTWHYKGTANLPQPDAGQNTFWAPQVFQNPNDKSYHMIVTYIKGIHENWEGDRQIFHYVSTDLENWKALKATGLSGCIDASVYLLPDSTWKMWYKNEAKGSFTYSASSRDLENWTLSDTAEVSNRHHEAPIVFYWHEAYWMITDPTFENYTGLDAFKSNDATHWTFNNR